MTIFRTLALAVLMSTGLTTAVFAQNKKRVSPPMSSTEIEMNLVTEKAEKCIITNDGSSGFCEDFRNFQQYVFKGSISTWLQYNIQNNNFNDANALKLEHMMNVMEKAVAIR